MNSKLKKTIAALIMLLCLLPFVNAQVARYKITTHNELAWAQHSDMGYTDRAMTMAQKFLDQTSYENYGEWLQQLSKECFINDSTPKKEIQQWWSELSKKKQTYEFTHEGPSVNANLKIYYFSPDQNNSNKEKQVVMVKEHGEWKVFSVK